MNKSEIHCSEKNVAKTSGRTDSAGRGRGRRRGGAAAAEGSNLRRNDLLAREAQRLLAALGLPEARALVDPTDENDVILQRKKVGVSIGAGRFSRAAAEDLRRNDLACWSKGEAGQRSLSLTEAGRARLRRSDAPDPEAAFFHQHRETVEAHVETGTGMQRVRVDAEESPLDWLRRRKGRDGQPLIDEASYQAGERLRTDIMLAGLLPGVTARWDATPRGGPASPSDATDRMVAARQRLRHAFDAVGADFADLLTDLCGFLKGLETIERERQWPPRSAKVVVRLALARLAEHYGIESAARGPAASRGIRAWQAVVIEGGRS
ncbi:MAG TPA: DUF6456 domain-containing protein [Microvirga sp.]|nr:DUF6456 domain-containing protein [Microvirga sp.]